MNLRLKVSISSESSMPPYSRDTFLATSCRQHMPSPKRELISSRRMTAASNDSFFQKEIDIKQKLIDLSIILLELVAKFSSYVSTAAG